MTTGSALRLPLPNSDHHGKLHRRSYYNFLPHRSTRTGSLAVDVWSEALPELISSASTGINSPCHRVVIRLIWQFTSILIPLGFPPLISQLTIILFGGHSPPPLVACSPKMLYWLELFFPDRRCEGWGVRGAHGSMFVKLGGSAGTTRALRLLLLFVLALAAIVYIFRPVLDASPLQTSFYIPGTTPSAVRYLPRGRSSM